jgi:hypothetical protein
VALSGVKNSGSFCILLPDDMDDFTTRPSIDVNVVQILETMQSSRSLPIPHISPGDIVESGIAPIDPSDPTLSDEFPCPDDYSDAPEDQIRSVPSLHHDAIETFDPHPAEIPLNVQIMSRILEDQQMLRFNCLGDFFLKPLPPDFLCLLRHFFVGYFQPVGQNSYWSRTNDYHS